VDLHDRVVIVTGAAQGIGAAIARELADRGATVAIGDIQPATATVTRLVEAGGRATSGHCDVTDPDSIRHFVDDTIAQHGTITGLVNNAAMFSTLKPTRFEDFDAATSRAIYEVNVAGTIAMISAVTPIMRAQSYGKIVNIGSGSVLKGSTLMLPYVVSKGAVHAIARALAREIGPDGIRINTVAPGLTLSDGVRNAGNLTAERINDDLRTRALAREQTPEDLTGTVAFLLSADSDFMTGQLLNVDGGAQLH
jgi:NAD(P)-dependent dehydrogenase (short-subunit alcohol dehydrogenase family)